MLNSYFNQLCAVSLPFQGRQHYMHAFDLSNPVMRPGFEDYIEPVMALTRAAGATRGVAYMTVDEKLIAAGMSQRRPRPHVDGCFMPRVNFWGHPGPIWLHHCNDIGHGPLRRMAVIVSSSVAGCRAWNGLYEGEPAKDGDLSHISNQLGAGDILAPNIGYLLSPDCIHESLIFTQETNRTFLRIALPPQA